MKRTQKACIAIDLSRTRKKYGLWYTRESLGTVNGLIVVWGRAYLWPCDCKEWNKKDRGNRKSNPKRWRSLPWDYYFVFVSIGVLIFWGSNPIKLPDLFRFLLCFSLQLAFFFSWGSNPIKLPTLSRSRRHPQSHKASHVNLPCLVQNTEGPLGAYGLYYFLRTSNVF